MGSKKDDLATRVIHAGRREPRIEGSCILPIFQSTVWEHGEGDGGYHEVRYPRLSNLPNHEVLGRRLASIAGAESGLLTGSGMGAISTAMLTVLGEGGHLLIQDQLYGGTHAFVTRDLPTFGLTYDFIAPDDPASWKEQLRPSTRAIYVETLTNPLLQVADLRAVVAFAREQGLVSMIDNTFATPVNFRPVEAGFDLELHSATKYLNGHNDVVAGALLGSAERVRQVKLRLDHLGAALDPHACYLLERGLKTLVLRLERQGESSLELARWLEGHEAVERVNHPGLESHPQHARARELFSGFGGMLSFEPRGGADAARRFVERVKIPINGPSLGGLETLVTRPVTTSHASLSDEELERAGIRAGLIRVSVGIESVEDLKRDFDGALR
jgi:cystathionine beta-lyase/cystathionine gamma-synthase